MTVSVVIPCYNSAATIGRAVGSVRSQTVGADEIIVVDDGSADSTAAIIEESFPACRLIRQANGGPAVARNNGVAAAGGDWIAFLDGDDAWLPWRLEMQLSAARNRPEVVLWCGDAVRVAADAEVPVPTAVSEEASQRALCISELVDCNPVATSTAMVKRDVFAEVGGFDARFRGPEDYDLWMRIVAKGHAVCIEAPLACHYVQNNSLSTDERKFLPQVLAVLDKAYGPGGALRDVGGERMARAYQYLCAAWMASCRGAPLRAMRLVGSSVMLWPWRFRNSQVRRWGRTRLAARILRDAVWS